MIIEISRDDFIAVIACVNYNRQHYKKLLTDFPDDDDPENAQFYRREIARLLKLQQALEELR